MDPLSALDASDILERARRVVLKIGSALLVDEASGMPRRPWLEALVDDIVDLRRGGREVLIVSSGAVAVGRRSLPLDHAGRPSLPEKQAAAAVGQVRLAHAYQEVLGRHGITAAQVLLTLDDSENRRRYLNARNTIDTLLRFGAVPVINENDTVATQEIRFGDNDRLAARVAQMTSADALILFSDIDGLYSADPNKDPGARFIPVVETLTPEILAMGGGALTPHGTGGMITKLAAAAICMEAGCAMAIAPGKGAHPVRRLREGGRGTWFLPHHEPRAARKAWISGGLRSEGTLVVDDGAARALTQGGSLLPAGVRRVEGDFQRGAAVRVVGLDGQRLAKGLVSYPAEEARLLMGHKSADIEALLGYRGRDELIHRDDLVLDAGARETASEERTTS